MCLSHICSSENMFIPKFVLSKTCLSLNMFVPKSVRPKICSSQNLFVPKFVCPKICQSQNMLILKHVYPNKLLVPSISAQDLICHKILGRTIFRTNKIWDEQNLGLATNKQTKSQLEVGAPSKNLRINQNFHNFHICYTNDIK